MQKICSKCKTEFGCKNEAPGCWCETVQLNETTLQYLENNFDNCLCYNCLKAIEANQFKAGELTE